jgi:Na+-transporting methylmalonyl-CoA/oxaloacetate decarboxylase gamma subunit
VGDIITERRREHSHRILDTEAVPITAVGVFVVVCVLMGLIALTWIASSRHRRHLKNVVPQILYTAATTIIAGLAPAS